MSTLYQLVDEMETLLKNEEATEEDLQAVFGAIQEKGEAICKVRANLMADIAAFKAEESRLAARRKSTENSLDRLEERLQQAMKLLQLDFIKAGTFSVKLQDNPQPALIIDDDTAIPEKYFIPVPATTVRDNAKIKEDLKAKKLVLGAHLEWGKHIRIR